VTPVRVAAPPDPKAERVRILVRRMVELAEGDEERVFNADIYKRFRTYLTNIFGGKCAYCEANLGVVMQSPVIEHYRPKGRITDENDVIVCDAGGNELPGYYWLAYEWGNLLPSCWVCNSTHKKNRFPVAGAHATDPTGVAAEMPLLYNPLGAATEPEQHFRIDLETGMLHGLDDIGRMTIHVLGLNRAGLVDDRRRALKDTANLISAWLPALALGRSDLADHAAQIDEIRRGTATYAFARRALYESAMGPIRRVAAA